MDGRRYQGEFWSPPRGPCTSCQGRRPVPVDYLPPPLGRGWTPRVKAAELVAVGRFWGLCRQCAADATAAARSPRPPARACARCGEEFEPRRPEAVYCSGACRQAAYRARLAR
jgi:hypothetical protein